MHLFICLMTSVVDVSNKKGRKACINALAEAINRKTKNFNEKIKCWK